MEQLQFWSVDAKALTMLLICLFFFCIIMTGGTSEGEASQDSVGLSKLGGPGEKNRKLQKKYVHYIFVTINESIKKKKK